MVDRRSAEYGVWRKECGVGSAEREERSANYGVRCAKSGGRSADYGVQSAKNGFANLRKGLVSRIDKSSVYILSSKLFKVSIERVTKLRKEA